MLLRVAEAVCTMLPELIAADQVRYIVSENTRHLPRSGAYAGFRFGTAHGALVALHAQLTHQIGPDRA